MGTPEGTLGTPDTPRILGALGILGIPETPNTTELPKNPGLQVYLTLQHYRTLNLLTPYRPYLSALLQIEISSLINWIFFLFLTGIFCLL